MKLASTLKLGLIALAATVCMAASGGCGTSVHKATVSAGAIAASLHTAATVNHGSPLESPDEKKLIATYIVTAAAANDNFIGVLKTAQSNPSAGTQAEVYAAFQALLTRVNQLQSQGVLQLKSPQAQADFSVIMASIQAEFTVIESLYPAPTASGKRPLPHPGSAPLAAIVLTAEEIEELIALAIAAGSALVPKLMALKGETDPEILAQASADDVAAEEIAESDGATKPGA